MTLEELLSEDFYGELMKARDFIEKNESFRVISHYDGDGTSSAIILLKMLLRKEKRFHLGYIKNLGGDSFRERMNEERDLPTIIVDAGSDQAKFVPDFENLLILDHHFYQKTDIKGLNINARDFGVNGTREACGSTMAYITALALDENNRDLFPFFLSGVIADKQDIGGVSGLNKIIYDAYGSNYQSVHTINLEGENLLDALSYSTDPFFNNISGNRENSRKILQKLQIDFEKRPLDLTEDEKRKLAAELSLAMLKQGVGSEAMKYLETDLLKFPGLEFSSKEISSIIDGNSKIGKNSISVEYFLGNNRLKKECIDNWKIFKSKLIDYSYRAYKELFEESHLRYFYAPESEMAGSISGLMMLYLVPQDKPLIGFSVSDGTAKVSGRGTRRQVEHGLNLSVVMKNAAQANGGDGGGHDIAAGAVIPNEKVKSFVEMANSIVREQLSVVQTT
ncbi:MAG: DHH family phosphoesterase [Thermoplasmata archaeon]